MAELIVGGPELELVEEFPFPGCDIPPVLIGPGEVFIQAGGVGPEVQAGNFSLETFSDETETVRVFDGSDEDQSAMAITSAHRFEMVGDSFAMANLSRLLNQPRVPVIDGEVLGLTTVRVLTTHRVRMTKTLRITDSCVIDACATLELVLWRVYFEPGFSWALTQAEITTHTLKAVALPDQTDHPAQPFGYLKLVCPQEALS